MSAYTGRATITTVSEPHQTLTGEVLKVSGNGFDFRIDGASTVNYLYFSEWTVTPLVSVPQLPGAVVRDDLGILWIRRSDNRGWRAANTGALALDANIANLLVAGATVEWPGKENS